MIKEVGMSMSILEKQKTVPIFIGLIIFNCCGLPDPSGKPLVEVLKEARTMARANKITQEWCTVPPVDTFYGKVVDTLGVPIPEATVNVSWYTVSPTGFYSRAPQRETLKTDKNGCFNKKCKQVSSFFSSASKEGYVDVTEGSRNFLNYRAQSEANPVIITMRKKGPLSFLIVSPATGRLPDTVFHSDGTSAVNYPLDLLSWKSGPGWKYCATTNADLRIDAAFDAAKKCWNVTYSITNGPGGIVLSDKMLYEAPADGYAPSVSVTVTNVYDWRRYLYVKSRAPAIYSRVLFEHSASVGTNPSLRVSCKAWVNPYGDHSLEYDERADSLFGLEYGLRCEAVAALASGKYPERPDMAKRVDELREQLRKAKEEDERQRNSPEARRIREESERIGKKAREARQQEAHEKWLKKNERD